MKDVTKPWKQKFIEPREREKDGKNRDVLIMPKHGWNLKEMKNAGSHRRKSDRAK